MSEIWRLSLPADEVLRREHRLLCELDGVRPALDEADEAVRCDVGYCGRGVEPYGWGLAKS